MLANPTRGFSEIPSEARDRYSLEKLSREYTRMIANKTETQVHALLELLSFEMIGDGRVPSLALGISEKSYFNIPCCATAILSRLEFFTIYIISSAWRMISCELLASSG